MARPKKEVTQQTVETADVKPNFTCVLLGLHRSLDNNNLYDVIEIPYDPVTGITGEIKMLHRDVFEDAADRLKINVAEKVLTRSNG